MPTREKTTICDQPLSKHLRGLDLLRAIAIACVMCFHSFLVGGLNEHFAWLSRFGWMGVDLFFVLSGFLIGSQVLYSLTHGQSPDSTRGAWESNPIRLCPNLLTLWFAADKPLCAAEHSAESSGGVERRPAPIP
jgi:peptidoglycan/LPS O-acetylase OafA/YrhL